MSRTPAFWDSSALIPLCIREQTSNHAKALSRQYAASVWWGTEVEVYSAIARLYRFGEIDDLARRASLPRCVLVKDTWRQVIPSDEIRDQATVLLDRYPLRAADSLQLAAATIWCNGKPTRRNFIAGDLRLCEAATNAGFTVLRTGLAQP